MSNQIYIDFHNVIKYAISILFVWNNNIAIISYYNNEAKKKIVIIYIRRHIEEHTFMCWDEPKSVRVLG